MGGLGAFQTAIAFYPMKIAMEVSNRYGS